MNVSVALCTHNGERYLQEQLDSIVAQTRPPDELVVHDDASTDRTAHLLHTFIARAPFPVKLTINPQRLGSTANFQNAIAGAGGEVIVLSDQDDVWRPEKLDRLEAAFAGAPEVACVFSDAEIVDETLRPLGYRLWDALRLDVRKQHRLAAGAAVEVLLQQNFVTGATMAFRSSLRDLVLPVPSTWVHDGWIALLAAAVGRCLPLDTPLLRYRQHSGQQIGGRKRTLPEQVAAARKMDRLFFDALAENYQAARDRLAKWRTSPYTDEVLARFDEKVVHCRRRAAVRECRWRLPLLIQELMSGRYARYSLGWKSVASDLLL